MNKQNNWKKYPKWYVLNKPIYTSDLQNYKAEDYRA